MLKIKKISTEDIENVVKIHMSSFSGFFLTELGERFLYVYYRSMSLNDKCILLGIFDEDGLCGFCAAASISKGFNKQLILKNIISFSMVGLRIIYTRPTSLFRIFKNIRKTNSQIVDPGEYAELFSIAVSLDKQGLGIGKKLLLALEEELKSNGCKELTLTTDYYENKKTITFYRGLNYNVLYEFIAYPNRKMYRMIKKIK